MYLNKPKYDEILNFFRFLCMHSFPSLIPLKTKQNKEKNPCNCKHSTVLKSPQFKNYLLNFFLHGDCFPCGNTAICKARSLLMPQKMEEKKQKKTQKKTRGLFFVFTDSAKPRADTDVTREKGCHSPLFPALSQKQRKGEKHFFPTMYTKYNTKY